MAALEPGDPSATVLLLGPTPAAEHAVVLLRSCSLALEIRRLGQGEVATDRKDGEGADRNSARTWLLGGCCTQARGCQALLVPPDSTSVHGRPCPGKHLHRARRPVQGGGDPGGQRAVAWRFNPVVT